MCEKRRQYLDMSARWKTYKRNPSIGTETHSSARQLWTFRVILSNNNIENGGRMTKGKSINLSSVTRSLALTLASHPITPLGRFSPKNSDDRYIRCLIRESETRYQTALEKLKTYWKSPDGTKRNRPLTHGVEFNPPPTPTPPTFARLL